MSIGQTNTELKHVEHAWRLLNEASDKLRNRGQTPVL